MLIVINHPDGLMVDSRGQHQIKKKKSYETPLPPSVYYHSQTHIYKEKKKKKNFVIQQRREKGAIVGKRAVPRALEIETLPWPRNDKLTAQLCFLLMLY